MRILLTSPVFPPDLGGPAIFVPSLANYFLERGHEVQVVAFCEEGQPQGYPYPVHAIPRTFLPLRYLKSFFKIYSVAKDVDVVYVNEHLALLAILAAKLRHKKCAVRVMVDGSWEIAHRYGWTDDDIDTYQTKTYGFKVWLVRKLQKWWWRKADAIVCVSDYLRRIVQGYGVDPRKLHLIHNAYNGPRDFAITREEAREDLNVPADRKVLVTVCRLMIWKGVDGILKALTSLDSDTHLYVVGDGDEMDNWQQLSRDLGLAERVHFVGNRPHEETLKWIRAADVFLLNSRYEGLSHTLLEVMFLETPIICSSVCGNPELVENGVNGILVPYNDVPSLELALRKLLSDHENARIYAKRSKEKVKAHDRERLFSRLEELLEGL